MKRIVFVPIVFIFISSNLFAQNPRNSSVSFDPLTFIGAVWFFSTLDNENEEPRETNFSNIWFSMDINWETEKQKEMGVGIFLGPHRVYLKTQYRSFYNKKRQSGFFWGLYGLIEWRRMFWFYDEDDELAIGWNFPFTGRDNVYHSIGITGGFDIGFRFRRNNFGITPYAGLGIPLFFYLGSLPPQNNIKEFNVMNIALRAINIGVKLDFFY